MVGHVEWVDFAVVERLPAPGAIVHATEHLALPGGGGAVAAVNLARMTGGAPLFTALGDDELGVRAADGLRARGVELHAVARGGVPQRRALTHLSEDDHERTITVVGERHVPHGSDALPWDELASWDGCYFTGGDAGALRAARAARVLVATPRARGALLATDPAVDVLVASASDPGERTDGLPARLVVLTRGAHGGEWRAADGTSGTWDAAPLTGPPVDSYGCGDTFAAALTLALAARRPLDEALAFAARAGAAVLTGRGPYGAALPRPG